MPDATITNIIAIAAAVGALVFLGRFVLSVVRMAAKIDEMLPVMLDISRQFRTNTGSSLKDQINRLESAATDAKRAAESAATDAKRAAESAATVAHSAQQTLDRLVIQQAVWLETTRKALSMVNPVSAPPE